MKPVLGLRTCMYKVGDLPKAIEWYNKAFQTEPYFNEPFYVGYNIAGFELGLQSDSQKETPKSQNVWTYWGVEDIEEAFNHFLSIGATEIEAPNNVGDDIMVAAVGDPWNNIVGLIYNPHFKIP